MKRSIVAILALLLAACTQSDMPSGDDWPDYDGPTSTHYSPLSEINDGNVSRLGLAWHHDIGVGGPSMTAPVAVDGVLYMAAGATIIHAFDAATGKLLWQYDSKARETAGTELRAAWGSRGLAWANGRIFAGTADGRLIALDAKSGKLEWTAQTTTKGDGRYITGAPWVYGNKVVIGHGGADFGPVRGYVTAYDQDNGKQAWRFFTVPGDPAKGFEDKAMAMAARTWKGEWWKHGGGGTVWNAMAYDPKYNRIYLGVGNGSPWNQKIRSPGGGDNLFLCSIVALDADSGEYLWHYQTNPGETWDFNSALDIELTELEIGGAKRDVLLHAPKNGFFYVIDRKDGKLISARNYVPVSWAKGIDPETGRPIENPEARFPDGKPVVVYPAYYGAHNIEAMSVNPATGLVYIPAMDQGQVYLDPPGDLAAWRHKGNGRASNGIGNPPPGVKPRVSTSFLLAWNPVTQSEAWRVPMVGPRGGGGTATTAGNLVLQGRVDGQFTALSADSGKQLWSFDAQTGIMAQPITYRAGGKQYVAVVAGARFSTAQGLPKGEWSYRGQTWRLLVFALDGKDRLPPAAPVDRSFPDDSGFAVDPALAGEGIVVYHDYCAGCHGAMALSGGTAPDLLRSPMPLDFAAFKNVVHDGALLANGMPRFAELTDRELLAMTHFLRRQSRSVAAAGK